MRPSSTLDCFFLVTLLSDWGYGSRMASEVLLKLLQLDYFCVDLFILFPVCWCGANGELSRDRIVAKEQYPT